MTYVMKDLGYGRTPTNGFLVVKFTNDEHWQVPAQVIADSRDEYYADRKENTIGYIRKESLGDHALIDTLIDWVSNNMNWEDLQPYATKLAVERVPFDYEGDWGDAEKNVEGI